MNENDLEVKTSNAVTKPYLADTIDYDRDIAPYQFIKLFSDVGSGKNMLIDFLIQGKHFKHNNGTLVPPQNVLLITSRRTKADETLSNKYVKYDPYIGSLDDLSANWFYDDEDEYVRAITAPEITLPDLDGMGTVNVKAQSCVNTNAKIACFERDRYSPTYAPTHPWLRFNMIIIDEVHTLLSDATYQDASFYVRQLIKETLKQSSSCKVLVMTGSPTILNKDPLFDEAHLIDRMGQCKDVKPKRVHFITRKEATQLQRSMLMKGTKFIAFYNHIEDMVRFEEDTADNQKSSVVLTFSDHERLKTMEKNGDPRFERMVQTQLYLAEHQLLPNDVCAFLSTSRNREGINIKNTDIHYVFVESHTELDIVQMTGRLRNPADILYIVTDSKGHADFESPLLCTLEHQPMILAGVNQDFRRLCLEIGYDFDEDEPDSRPVYTVPELKKHIELVHSLYAYYRFDYFSRQYLFFNEREIGRKYYAAQQLRFADAMNSTYDLGCWLHKIYPGVPFIVSNEIEMHEDMQAAVDAYIQSNRLLSRTLRAEDKKKICEDLEKLFQRKIGKLKTFLKKHGYDIKENTKSKNANAPIRIVKIQAQLAA